MTKIRLAGTVNDSITDGPGLRFAIFVQGCPHNCPGCHNPQTHDFLGGYDDDTDSLFERIIKNPLLDGVTFSGGEPFCQARPLAELAVRLRAAGLGVMSYSGFTVEELIREASSENAYMELLNSIDYLVDGRFVESLKSYECRFRGSTNQRIIDVKKTIEQGHAVTCEL